MIRYWFVNTKCLFVCGNPQTTLQYLTPHPHFCMIATPHLLDRS